MDKSKLPVHLVTALDLLASVPHKLKSRLLLPQFIATLFKTITGIGCPNDDVHDRIAKRWSAKSLPEVIEEADALFHQGKYLEVYETLDRIKYADNTEAQWRLSRALFKLSFENTIPIDVRKEIIEEAYHVIMLVLSSHDDCAKAHKWAAIVIDRRNGMDGLEKRVRESEVVKNHLIKCCELDPNDVSAQYLLGRWCYEMSNITWFQRIVATLLYGEPPKSSYEEAHKYLSKAEDLYPKFYLQNTYLLGKTCLKLGQYYRAKHYFGVVGNLPIHNEYEKHCAADAKRLLKRLDKYNLERNALFYEYPFGNE